MDVDSVAEGAAGKDQAPVDFNRCWGPDPHWNAVRAAMQRIDDQTRRHELVCFLDVHNPWFAGRSHWHLYPTDPIQRNTRLFAERFVAALEEFGGANSWNNAYNLRFAIGPDKVGVSKNYAADPGDRLRAGAEPPSPYAE